MPTTETDKAIKEIWEMFKETDRKFKETDRKFKETNEEWRVRAKGTDVELKELTKQLQITKNNIDGLTGKWSKFVEGIIVPCAVGIFKKRGIEIEKLSTHIKGQKNGVGIEIDILLINEKYIVLIEVKSTLKVEDVNEHIKRLGKFKKVFPEYKDRQVLGAVAGIVIEESADRYAYRQGMYVIGQSRDTAKILNDKKFKPKIW